ncbi:MAG: hypothetical protein UV64_C0036G0006 [Parcubacteria group bacterium GW2011_GWC1_43_11b]|nr:MAG: hypothetical protein UV64_C0036G0006 [Parcubacteria group bacterium GW2011_GWC1_43_11b]
MNLVRNRDRAKNLKPIIMKTNYQNLIYTSNGRKIAICF